MTDPKNIIVAEYCICGAGMKLRTNPAWLGLSARAKAIFLEEHKGEGHGSCSAETASRARRKAEKRDEEGSHG